MQIEGTRTRENQWLGFISFRLCGRSKSNGSNMSAARGMVPRVEWEDSAADYQKDTFFFSRISSGAVLVRERPNH